MQRVLPLSRERDTRDKLGLGGIRDTFADTLFPGTSTIQTRAAMGTNGILATSISAGR